MEKTETLSIDAKLIAITERLIQETGDAYPRAVKMNSSLQSLGIDSLGRAELFERIEKKFNISIPDSLLASADSLQDIANFIAHASPGLKENKPNVAVIPSHIRANVDPKQARSLTDILQLYANTSPDKPHIYFQHEDGKEEVITYAQLLITSLKVATSLRERGLKNGETVAIMLPSHPSFFYAFFGTLLAGGIPVPIYPPFRMHMLESYAKTEARILRNAEVRILITFDQAENLSRILKAFIPSLHHVTTVAELLQAQPLENPYNAKADNYAFIQYTSGSTADPKGVLLTHYNLLSNIQAYGEAIKVTPDDTAVSWLPLYHDMGLIGLWLGSLYFGIPLVVMTPFSFLNHPERWLWAIHYHRGTLSGAPNFAYELCVRKIDPHKLEGLDLSSWRVAANGAEKVYPRTIEQFIKKFQPYQFNPTTLMPVFGLAESTVCLTVPPLGRGFIVDHIDRRAFELEKRCVPTQSTNELAFVSCGIPIPRHEMRIVDDLGAVLEERHVGNLQFRGPSNMQGYFNNPTATAAVYHDGWIDAGDLAYIADKELYITGRRKDLIIKAGRNLYPAEIEELVGAIPGVRQGCVTAFGVSDVERATEEVVVVAETRDKNPQKRDEIREKILQAIAATLELVPDKIILTPPHSIPKTSSGKLQRAQTKAIYLQGQLGKTRMPAWLQLSRLGAGWFAQKVLSSMQSVMKFIYTLYIAVLVGVSLFPVYLMVLLTPRNFAAKVCKAWANFLRIFAFCPQTIIGKENLTKFSPMIFVGNHSSYLDAVIMLGLLPSDTRFIGKAELMSMPIFRTFMKKLGYVPVDRVNLAKGLEDTKIMETTLRAGHSLLIFPEGTFSYASGLRPFRLGAFKLAAQTQTPICPISLKGVREILRGDEKLMRPNKITVTVSEPVMPPGSEWQDVTHLRSSIRSEIAKYCGEPSLEFLVAQAFSGSE